MATNRADIKKCSTHRGAHVFPGRCTSSGYRKDARPGSQRLDLSEGPCVFVRCSPTSGYQSFRRRAITSRNTVTAHHCDVVRLYSSSALCDVACASSLWYVVVLLAEHFSALRHAKWLARRGGVGYGAKVVVTAFYFCLVGNVINFFKFVLVDIVVDSQDPLKYVIVLNKQALGLKI